jgi:hypothetical protein
MSRSLRERAEKRTRQPEVRIATSKDRKQTTLLRPFVEKNLGEKRPYSLRRSTCSVAWHQHQPTLRILVTAAFLFGAGATLTGAMFLSIDQS